MDKKMITRAEKTNMFNEWLLTQEMPNFKETVDRQRWWVNKVVEFDRMNTLEYDVCAEIYVDDPGEE